MCIPSSLTRNHITLHCSVSWNHILNNSCKYMSNMWLTISSWRSVIECVSWAFLSVINTLLEDIIVFPELFNFFFSVYELHVRRNFLINHCSFLSCLLAYIFQYITGIPHKSVIQASLMATCRLIAYEKSPSVVIQQRGNILILKSE